MKAHIRLLLMVGLAYGAGFGWAWAVLSTPSLRLDVFPPICVSPCTFRVTVRVDPQPDNRHLFVAVAGDNYESTSDIELDGENAPRTHVLPLYQRLPMGRYEVVAILQTSVRTVARATQTIEVN